ncbi:MAG: OsmC family protein [Ignavibacteria bacterium]|jgi:ribosomal protein S12 methylthiotransferase accessory factor|nr:OsmC family protein [Ignavibacteria bacterium]
MKMEILFEGNKKVSARFNGYTIKTDQPENSGGEGSAPSPFDLFLSSIGTCAGFYVKSFCDQRNIPADNIKIVQTMDFNNETHLISNINVDIQLPPDFPEKYRSAVIASANLCTVKKHLANPPALEVTSSVNENILVN